MWFNLVYIHVISKLHTCRDDCLKLLSRCSDSEVTPEAVCDIIAPASTQEYCISLKHLLGELIHPCSSLSINFSNSKKTLYVTFTLLTSLKRPPLY